MKIRGFDKDFLIAAPISLVALVAVFWISEPIANWLRVDRLFVGLALAGALWFGLDRGLKRLQRLAEPELEPVLCEWDSKIDDSTFAADGELTRLSLESHGLTVQSAVGRQFVCMTECADDAKDYFFDGLFVETESGDIAIKALHPEQIPVSE